MMSAQKYPADSWGGVQVGEYYGGAPPRSALFPSTARPTQAQWDEEVEIPDEQFCASISSKTNAQCRAYKVKGELHCHFHLRQASRLAASASEQKVREERERASDGAEPGTDP